jgi:cytochrome c oxidase subunit III
MPTGVNVRPAHGLSTTQLGMRLLLASLSVLFLASAAAVLITHSAPGWRPPLSRGLPNSLWLSTGLIALTSAFVQAALNAIRRNRRNVCQRWLVATGAAATAFLMAQGLTARGLLAVEPSNSLFVFCYYLLLAVHALHVLGGLVPLAWVLRQSAVGQYSSSRYEGLQLCTQYFHFLGAMWLLVLATLGVIT